MLWRASESSQSSVPLKFGGAALWAFDYAPLLLAIFLRLLLPLTYRTSQGYDFFAHLQHIDFITANHRLAPLDLNNASYHPPLFYVLAALLRGLGLDAAQLIVLPMGLGIARLGLLFYGLRRYLPDDRLARGLAMTLAGVLPCALQLDGMLTNEALLGPLSLLATLLLPLTFSVEKPLPVQRGLWLGLLIGAMLLTKISALVMVFVVGIGVAGLLFAWRAPLRDRLRFALPLVCALTMAALLALPHAARSYEEVKTPFPTAFETLSGYHAVASSSAQLPLLDRRPLGYVFGLSRGQIFWEPFTPTSIDRFSIALLASSFVDYYNYGFAGPVRSGERQGTVNGRPLTVRALWLMRGALLGGFFIASATIAAWILSLRALYRRRDFGLCLVLLLPLFGVLGQLHFATKYPLDYMGMVKGHYLQFVAAPLFALYGVAMSWLWRRSRGLFSIELMALFLVALYTLGTRRLIFS
jgi:hypothetical protein